MREFDGDTWKYNALVDYVAFKELHDFVTNEEATKAHVNSYEVIGNVERFSALQVEEMRAEKICTLKETLSHFASQTIISLCTTFEVSAREYIRALFCIKPSAMFDFLGAEESRGNVPLKDILQALSHAELVERLADRASSVASKGKYGQVYLRALSLSGRNGGSDLVEKLNTLQVDRNKFVHERHRPVVGIENVRAAHVVVDDAIENLCWAGVGLEVPGKYTCVQPLTKLIMESAIITVKKKM